METYMKKIERICSNKFESGLTKEEFEKNLADVYAWLYCEWQCGGIEDMADIEPLKAYAKEQAEECCKS